VTEEGSVLRELRIRNLAVIESAVVGLAPGFNVLTGETGAGKSLVVGALAFLLGERGSGDMVRSGSERARVEGTFDCSERSDVVERLDELGIEAPDGLLVLRREVSASGKSRAWINDTSVTTATLSGVGRMLADLHGQHEAQTLLRQEVQLEVLDRYAGAGEARARVAEAFARWSEAREAVEALEERRQLSAERAEYLQHLVREIGAARIRVGELEELEGEIRRLSHAESLRENVTEVLRRLDSGPGGVQEALLAARRALLAAQRLDSSLAETTSALESLLTSAGELARDLERYTLGLESDPQRLLELEARRARLHDLMRKYGGAEATLVQRLHEAESELATLEAAPLEMERLEREVLEAQQALDSATASLSSLRASAAADLAAKVEALLPELGLSSGRFSIALEPRGKPNSEGAESAEFLVSLNLGHELRPLARVASGGELSRLMLGLKTVLAAADRVPTLVFDEVDVGIGGAVALRVGDALRRLATHHQVLVVTHLAQIASRAHHHLVVSKGGAALTSADVRAVAGEERVAELARMLGGDPESPASRAHARELLERAGRTSSLRATRRRSA
jgi:DNA repair protein RecN (Recombination protein N)